MTLQVRNFDGAVGLDTVQLLQRAVGTGVTSGCAASLTSSSTDITVDVASGEVAVENTTVAVSSATVTLADGDAQYPRKDVIVADSTGVLHVVEGTPREAKANGILADTATDRQTYQPEPPDLSDLSDVSGASAWTEVAPIAEVWVPAGTTASSEMDDSTVTYVSDRRVRPWPDATLTSADEGDGNGLDADTVDGYEGSDLAALAESESVTGAWTFDSDVTITQDTAVDLSAGGELTLAAADDGANGQVTLDTGSGTNYFSLARVLDDGGKNTITLEINRALGHVWGAYDKTANDWLLRIYDDGTMSLGAAGTTGQEAMVRTDQDLAAEAIAEPDADSFSIEANDDYEQPVFVPDGKTLTVYAWGLRLDDGSTDSGIVLELNDPSGTTQASIDASVAPNYTENESGVASYSNSTGSPKVAHLRLANTTGTDYTPSDEGGNGIGVERTVAYRVN
ncbi:hypothetical protein SAMN04487947_1217 [Halogeometricum rufum]|uniref:Uncharacterized protein n=1 Tax=Halogeometricum rufum TaxID=553469 RepID=A0A1I6GIP8_9EURY|nr:hypothetical protein [Halogeometricum rufum]SFR42050.1 hypothetical protein SAMN04487947_1217 [Halogeometricum rufum]